MGNMCGGGDSKGKKRKAKASDEREFENPANESFDDESQNLDWRKAGGKSFDEEQIDGKFDRLRPKIDVRS